MELQDVKIGVAICASCCTYHRIKQYIKKLIEKGADVTCILSTNAQKFNTRFGDAESFVKELEEITGKEVLKTIVDVEPLGPKNLLDLLLIAPCTGNSLAKLANAISDTPVTMAAKSMLRNGNPVVIALTTNDGLGLNMRNIGTLMDTKDVYFVPLGQDNYKSKPHSLSADLEQLIPTAMKALDGEQIQPIMINF